ncbi:MAG: FkbM family methyltransferase, partial [archaeon]
MNLIFRKINAFRKLTYAIPKKCKKPYLFMVAYFFNTYFKLKIIKTVELKNGLKFNLTKNTDYLVVIEYCYNYYNIQNITAGNIVIDVGANAGDFSIFISPVIKKIYAFEPVPKTYKRFLNNIKLNKLKNIYPFQLG